MSEIFNNSIFWIDVDKVKPNPFQPRREFDELKLKDLAESIRQYGVLQPLTVTRKEVVKEDGGLVSEYELIAGERRLRASKLAGIAQVPVIIRTGEDSDRMKLELAIIENLQREDLNPVDRAMAFKRLVDDFSFKHADVARKVGKSREYVSNSLRILMLPQDVLDALMAGKISEGHTRPILMLIDRPEEQATLFKEILFKKMTVREAERIARHIATEKIRKKEYLPDPMITEMEDFLTERLGTRVHIERKEVGGKIMIDFFSTDDLKNIMELVRTDRANNTSMLDSYIATQGSGVSTEVPTNESTPGLVDEDIAEAPMDDRGTEEIAAVMEEPEEDLYSVKNFTI